ncbi:uncharacterized protein Z520_10002 [Fonsecaea multimorphosa CBS 102226]|uniref:Transcriptional activator HAP2 n=1 Tax=Fonsecaea multimorphosa CBS 102226 TaxID=1442371 RepID=A0A0D2JLT4_9EURO|nr:uncharacterized protein Z520_10002 [Fonsecaea multimorphosa CBS 102226]KIX94292.1 hypothetical protein Z520_10002 [Fonsecaea multimorphosa CBS 102226]OAL19973.1 hypothetical protein AYO22_09500 [Fonsecaea multimorphosa]
MEEPDSGVDPLDNLGDSPLYVNPKQFHRILKRRVARQKAREATIQPADTHAAPDNRSQGALSSASSERGSNHAWESSNVEKQYELCLPFNKDGDQSEKGGGSLSIESHTIKTPKRFLTIEDLGALGVNSEGHFSNWPYNCRYFVPELMNAEAATSLLKRDAEFYPEESDSPECFTVVDLTETGLHSFVLISSDSRFDERLRLSDLSHGSTRILFVSQKRLCLKNYTTSRYGLKYSTWLKILSSCEIPPDAVQVLHENNGCWGAHTSFCSDVKGMSCRTKTPNDLLGETFCAYHIWMKPRPWWNEEHFVYARHDFHSRRKLLVVVGTSLDAQRQRVLSQFRPATQPHLFSALLALATTWTKDLEEFVWEQDFSTQRLESDTGWSTVGHTQLKPLPREKLALRKDMILTKDALSHVVRASESLDELYSFLSREVRAIPSDGYNVNLRPDQLKDAFVQQACKQWHQKSQAQGLIDRLDTQWKIVSALMAQHNNSLNYQIATDSRVDTIVMRRISFVTIAFLPATFLATFFSMSFFHVTSDDLVASPAIWIYVVCAVPLTLAIAWQSSTRGLSAVKWTASKLRWRTPKKSVYFEE